MTRILVTGATGFLGRHLLPLLEARYGPVIGVGSRDYDLMDPRGVERLFADHRPEVVVHLAAYSGGIEANRLFPADFYYRNTVLTALMFEACARHKVDRLLYPMGGCSYPATAVSPIGEEQMWQGFPQKESAAYSSAKKMGIVAGQAYRQQHGLKASIVIPGNMYGEYDNFSLRDAHVIPAMIRRYHEARLSGAPEVVQWGTGTPVRDFVYAGDVARCMLWFLEHDEPGPVNISSGTRTSIRELAEAIAAATGYPGAIRFDTSKPDGQMVKIFDVAALKRLGLSCDTPLAEGLARTMAWFARNYADRGDGLRL